MSDVPLYCALGLATGTASSAPISLSLSLSLSLRSSIVINALAEDQNKCSL